MYVNGITNGDVNPIRDIQIQAANGLLIPDLHTELVDICRQLNDCLNLWSSYFSLTQTPFYQLSRDCTYNRTKLTREHLLKHEKCLIDLHEINYRLQNQQQQAANRLLDHYLDRATAGESLSTVVPYVDNEKADALLIGISAVHYSTAQLARAALALGMNVHSIFELETTHIYRSF